MRALVAAALLVAATGACSAEAPKICAAKADFARGTAFAVDDLKKRLSPLGVPNDKKTWEDVDSSCGVMTMMSGFAAMPRLQVGTGVSMDLQVAGKNGRCMATVVSLDGC